MDRLVSAVLAATFAFAVPLLLGADSPGGLLGATLGIVLVAALVLWRGGEPVVLSRACTPAGPVGAERRLRGAFRPQSNPDTPGRPRPRAPGNGHRPA